MLEWPGADHETDTQENLSLHYKLNFCVDWVVSEFALCTVEER